MKNLFMLFFGITLLVFSGCNKRVDLDANRTEVNTVVNQMIEAIETEDMDLFAKITAHDADMVNFGTDATERWVGWDALKDSIEKQFASFDKTKLTVKDQSIKVDSSGKVAWFSEIADWDVIAQREPTHIEGSRITGVLEKRDGNWVIVQFHISVPVSTQAAEY